MPALGSLLEAQQRRSPCWRRIYFAFLALTAAGNVFLRPEHPHFGLDAWPGFWPVFGFFVGAAMVLLMKRVVQPILMRQEDYYGDL